jgi:hypothetical protein
MKSPLSLFVSIIILFFVKIKKIPHLEEFSIENLKMFLVGLIDL